MHKFEMGLRIKVRKQMVLYKLIIYTDVVNKAMTIEREVNKEHTERKMNQKKKKIGQTNLKNKIVNILKVQIRDQ